MTDKIVNRALKVRLYPNEEQKTFLDKSLGLSRFFYNYLLNERIEFYKKEIEPIKENVDLKNQKYKSFKPTSRKQFKEEFDFAKECSDDCLCTSERNLQSAFNNFFKSLNKSRKGKTNKITRIQPNPFMVFSWNSDDVCNTSIKQCIRSMECKSHPSRINGISRKNDDGTKKVIEKSDMKAAKEIERIFKRMNNVIIEKMLNVNNISGLIINLIMIAALAAIGEELLFRSILQSSLIRVCKNAHIGIFITSAIFSFIHFEFYGFLPRLVLGLLLGYMFFYSRSIWVPMIMHFVNNGTAVVLYYLNNKGITNIDVETFGQTKVLPLILSIIAVIALFWFVIRSYNKEFKTEK